MTSTTTKKGLKVLGAYAAFVFLGLLPILITLLASFITYDVRRHISFDSNSLT